MQPQCAPLRWFQLACRLAAHDDVACYSARIFAGQGHQQFFLPVARNAGNAHDLARSHIKRDFLQVNAKLLGACQVKLSHFEHDVTGFNVPMYERRGFSANHEPAQ